MCGECGKTKSKKFSKIEFGRKITILNPRSIEINCTKYDTCVLSQQPACDWLFETEEHPPVFVELKGSDVKHGLLQLEMSIIHKQAISSFSYLISRVTHPETQSFIQIAKIKFAKKFHSRLNVKCPEALHAFA